MGEKAKNRIWIEMEKPESLEHAKLQCELTNNMLRRLAGSSNVELTHWFDAYLDRDGKVIYTYGNHGGDFTLKDNGHWFSLDFLGRA